MIPATPAFPPRRVLYIDQNIVPPAKAQRTALAKYLLRYAAAFPDRRLTVQCRGGASHASAHEGAYKLDELLQAATPGGLPPNLHIAYDRLQQKMQECDLCLGIASTMLAQGIASGIPTGVISDFGWKPAFGNILFRDSGCGISFDDLLADRAVGTPDPTWIARNIALPEAHRTAFLERLQRLAQNPRPYDARRRNLRAALRRDGVPPLSRLRRKAVKLFTQPRRFFADSEKPWCRWLGRRLKSGQ